MMAALAMSGDFAPACLMGMIHQQANRRALQREMHWRKTYVSHEFNWDDFATWNDGECQRLLNFPRDGAEKLGRLFFLPAMQSAPGTDGQLRQDSDGNPFWVTRNRTRMTIMEVVAVFLARMSTTAKWEHLAPNLGGRHWSAYKLVFGELLQLLYDFWFARLSDVRRYAHLMGAWAALVLAKTGASPRIVGFLDGTWVSVCKPLCDAIQRELYNRYHRGHGLKYQALASPGGLILDLFGPVVGRLSDSTMLRLSELQEKLEELSNAANPPWTHVGYADSAYAAGPHIMRGLKRNMLHTALMRELQTAMNAPRTSVEWGFGQIIADFPYPTARHRHKIYLSPVGRIWPLAALLSNCKSCYKGGNQISDYFNATMPSLEWYLDLNR
jgi:hypothetical protein